MEAFMDTINLADTYLAPTYGHFPLEIVLGKGSEVYDAQGKRYIDLGSGIAVNTFGVADEAWQQAVIAQIAKVQHTSNLYYSEPCAKLAQMLCQRTGMARVFFCNSGAEANECAIKVARKHGAETLGPDYSTIITLDGSFHGRTLTTLAATGQEQFHGLFQPLTPGFVSVPAGDKAALERAFQDNKVAGMLVECIQGEGGVNVLEGDYLRFAAGLCAEKDALFMVDEVQTGNGRTGYLYAYMAHDLHPDVVTTAKGLAGGLPIGACMMASQVGEVLGPGDHGSTFGGNPVSCAAAVSVLERIDGELLASVRAKGELIDRVLTGAPGIVSVSGAGLMKGIKTTAAAKDVVNACLEQGAIFLTAKDKVRMLPALNIPVHLLEEALDVLLDQAAALA